MRLIVRVAVLLAYVTPVCVEAWSVPHAISWMFGAEYCGGDWIKQDIIGLQRDLRLMLHGQHLVRDVVIKQLAGHWKNDPEKPLVLSFHGGTGVGKNYVSGFIAKHLYYSGMDSKFVKLFIGSLHFTHESDVELYKQTLRTTVSETVAMCPRSLFIFDDVDKMAPGVLDAIKPFLDHYTNIDGVDYRRSIFIFLSTGGDTEIKRTVYEHLEQGKPREDLTLKNMEAVLLKVAFNQGGLSKSSLIDRQLVSAYVPFLPLEKKHIKKCIQDNLEKNRKLMTEYQINRIADELKYYTDEYKKVELSVYGCRSVYDHVNMHMDQDL